jgi:hypothetical protein
MEHLVALFWERTVPTAISYVNDMTALKSLIGRDIAKATM